MAPYRRGDVVWHPAPFREGGRPYVVLSDDDHPFYGEEYVVVGVTATEHERAVALTPETWGEGGAPKPSWASPWYVLTVKDATITDRLGRLTEDATDEIATAVARLVGAGALRREIYSLRVSDDERVVFSSLLYDPSRRLRPDDRLVARPDNREH